MTRDTPSFQAGQALPACSIRITQELIDEYARLSGDFNPIHVDPQAGPELLIADEPTSALDVTVQLQVLAILDRLVAERGMGLIFISHDLRLVASFCDRVLVMYAGRVVEEVDARRLHDAQHPYTRGLLNCLPQLGAPRHPLPTLDRLAAWSA